MPDIFYPVSLAPVSFPPPEPSGLLPVKTHTDDYYPSTIAHKSDTQAWL